MNELFVDIQWQNWINNSYRIFYDKCRKINFLYRRHVPFRASRWDLSPRHLRFSPCCRTSVGRMRLGTSTSRRTPSLDTLVVDKTLSRKRESGRSRRFVPVSSLCHRRNFYRQTLRELWKRSTSLIPFVRNKRRAYVCVCVCIASFHFVICFCFYTYWKISKATCGNPPTYWINQGILHPESFPLIHLNRPAIFIAASYTRYGCKIKMRMTMARSSWTSQNKNRFIPRKRQISWISLDPEMMTRTIG